MTLESSNFSSEFVVLKTCVEHIICLRFELRIFDIPIDVEVIVLNDNKSVVDSSLKLESFLKNKLSPISNHLVIWKVATGVVCIGYRNMLTN